MENPNKCSNLRNLTPQALREHLLEEKEKGRLAFILGNGINRYNPNELSWNELIKQVWSDCFEEGISIPSDGISLTELYDMATLNEISKINPEDTDLSREIKKVADNIKSRIREKVKEMVCQKIDYHEWLQKRLAKWNVPVLTTNYDTNIESGMKQFVIPSRHYKKRYSDTYLFNVYYADKPIDEAAEENFFRRFAVWHINGRVNHTPSIRIGMSDYMNLLVKTKELLHDKARLYYVGKDQRQWGMKNKEERDYDNYTFTWLNIFYNSSICINGLALNQDESYLRWLLISRKKYLKRVGLNDVKGWYICHPSDLTEGKRLFLENTGLKVVEFNDYRERYEKIFEI